MKQILGANQIIRRFATDSLYRNATYLAASTGIMSLLGFAFWLFVSHLYSTADIGRASAVISICLLVANLSMLGLNMGLIRFIPESKSPSEDINAALVTVGLTAVVASAVYLVLGRYTGTRLSFFESGANHGVIFCLLLAAVALNSLTDSVFIASRKAQYHTIAYAVFAGVRLLMAVLLVPLGAIGIFMAFISGATISLALSLYFMKRNCAYRPLSRPNFTLLARTRGFAANNYIAFILGDVPAQIMPTFIVSQLGPSDSAYFSMAWTMVNVLYIIPSSVAQSLLAEGSHDSASRMRDLRRAAIMLLGITVPLVVLSVVIAPVLLRLFGSEYAVGSTTIFQIFAVGTIFQGVNALGMAMLNIEQRTTKLVQIQFLKASVTVACAYLLLPLGLVGVGLAFLIGNGVGAASFGARFFLEYRHEQATDRVRRATS